MRRPTPRKGSCSLYCRMALHEPCVAHPGRGLDRRLHGAGLLARLLDGTPAAVRPRDSLDRADRLPRARPGRPDVVHPRYDPRRAGRPVGPGTGRRAVPGGPERPRRGPPVPQGRHGGADLHGGASASRIGPSSDRSSARRGWPTPSPPWPSGRASFSPAESAPRSSASGPRRTRTTTWACRGLGRWVEDLWSGLGPLALILFPLLTVAALGLAIALLVAMQRRAEARAEASKVPCRQCGQMISPCALACPHCRAEVEAPRAVGLLGQDAEGAGGPRETPVRPGRRETLSRLREQAEGASRQPDVRGVRPPADG